MLYECSSIVLIVNLEQQIVPHDEIKQLFDVALPQYKQILQDATTNGTNGTNGTSIVLKAEHLCVSSDPSMPSHTTRLMYSASHLALEKTHYPLCAKILNVLAIEHMNSLDSFLAIERGQHFFTRLAGHMLGKCFMVDLCCGGVLIHFKC